MSSGGTISNTIVSSGGTIEFVGGGTGSATLSVGAILELGPGYVASGNVTAANLVKVLSGGTQSGGAILSGGILDILTGGVVSGITVSGGGTEIVLSGGTASGDDDAKRRHGESRQRPRH